MKVALVLDDSLDKPDGVQQYVLTLGEWLMAQGHTVRYLVGSTQRKDIEGVHSLSKNIRVRFNKNRASMPLPADKKKLRELLHSEVFDVLHVQMPYSPFLAGRLIGAAGSATAVVGTFHIFPYGSFQTGFSKALGLITKSSLQRFDAIMSTSPAAQKFAKDSFKINSVTVPNPVNLAQFSGGKKLKRYQGGKTNIVFLGRLVERKGALELLRAINELKQRNQLAGLRVIVCGKGPLEKSLKAYVSQEGLGSVVEFVGFVGEKDKASYLKTADIAVFPSLGGESFGIVLLEAMASGSGVVLGGNNPGYQSVLGARPQLLFDPANTNAFADTLLRFTSDTALKQTMYKWQQQHIKQFDINIVGKNILDVYNHALHMRNNVR